MHGLEYCIDERTQKAHQLADGAETAKRLQTLPEAATSPTGSDLFRVSTPLEERNDWGGSQKQVRRISGVS